MHKFSVSKDLKKISNDKRRRDMIVGKVVAHLCLTLGNTLHYTLSEHVH